jgi:hypothetical protein
MPSHDRVRLDEHQRCAPIPPKSGQCDPKEPIVNPKTRAFGRSLHGRELPERQIFQDQFFMTAARQRQRTSQQDQQLQH